MTASPSRRTILLGGAGLLGAGFLASCSAGGAAEPAATTTTASGDPVVGGELRFAFGNDPASLNPQGGGTGNDTRYVNRQLFDSLLAQDPETGELSGWLATDYEVSEDSTEFTLTLRDDVTFSDGTPLTAQVVLDNFEDVVAQGANANYAAEHFAGWSGGEVVDEQTLVVRFEQPSIPFLQALSDLALAPLAPASLAQTWEERLTAPVGTGPFVLESYTKDTEVVLARRDGYAWGPPTSSNTGEAYLDRVVFSVLPEASVRTGAVSSGQADVIGGVPPQDQDTLGSSGFTLVERANPGVVFGITPYAGRPLLGDVAVRRALALALNRTQLRDATLNDSYAVATSVLASSTPGWSDQSALITEDADEAGRLLDTAGWTLGEDGVRVKDGEPLRLDLWWSDNFVANQSAVELVQAQAREVGFDIELFTGDVNQRIAAQDAGEVDLSWGNLSRPDADILRTQFAFDDSDVNQPPDPELNALLEEQRALTGTERDAVVDEAVARLITEGRYLPVLELTTVLALEQSVIGVELGPDSRLAPLLDAYLDDGS